MNLRKVNEVIERVEELKRTLSWCNKNLDKARKNMKKFVEKYVKPLDSVFSQLNEKEIKLVDDHFKNKT